MHHRHYLVRASLLIVSTWLVPTIGRAQQTSSGFTPTASTIVRIEADSLYRIVLDRLKARGYRLDEADLIRRQLVVRAPGDDTKVELRITPTADSSAVTITPLGTPGPHALQAMMTVSRDAILGIEANESGTPGASGFLPKARWRPELFVSPKGKFWMARGGLYTADSLRGGWRRAFGSHGDRVDPDHLRLGVSMAFVNDTIALLGLVEPSGIDGRQLYRSRDGGRKWSNVAAADLASVDDMAAIEGSVWVLGTRWKKGKRRGLFLRSNDRGATWERPVLPPELNNMEHLHRVSQSIAYVATAGYNRGPVFWMTTDAGNSWASIPTPHDMGLHDIPSNGSRVEQIATVGDWLVVREYGAVFISRADSIHWRRLDGIKHIAADRELDQLFVLTDSLYAEVLDRNLNILWRSKESIVDSEPTNVEKILARGGIGYVSMSHGEIYEARDGTLHLVQPKASSP